MLVTIRSRLLLLVLALLLPALLGVVWIIGSTFRAERDANTRTLRDSARALAMVVDRELRQRSTLARLLAQSSLLDGAPDISREQLRQFEQHARRGLIGIEGWIELREAGRVLLDTRLPAGTSPPPGRSEGLAPAFGLSDRPQVQPRHAGTAGAQDAHAAIVEPVQRDGRTLLTVVVAMRPLELQRMIDAQALPEGWVGTVVDSQGIVVARHPGGSAYTGRQLTTDLRPRLANESEGVVE